jgi:hypothetical protein
VYHEYQVQVAGNTLSHGTTSLFFETALLTSCTKRSPLQWAFGQVAARQGREGSIWRAQTVLQTCENRSYLQGGYCILIMVTTHYVRAIT